MVLPQQRGELHGGPTLRPGKIADSPIGLPKFLQGCPVQSKPPGKQVQPIKETLFPLRQDGLPLALRGRTPLEEQRVAVVPAQPHAVCDLRQRLSQPYLREILNEHVDTALADLLAGDEPRPSLIRKSS